ncbi:TPA-induced transmembrane protein [Mixophyes fleayi]|uniref:TPA-induced transmembrane protein n=1 Tax=Mixophyes fleayi TaxID=3061075 RepID=UPI003F4DA314
MASDQNNHMVQMSLLGNNTETVRSKCNKNIIKKPKIWIALIFLLLIIVTIISLVLYSNVYIDEDEKQSADLQSNNTCRFTGFLNVTDSCLWDSWISNETSFQRRITNVYRMSPSLQYYFIAAAVEFNSGGENKSAIIQLNFSHPSNARKYPISTELVTGVLRQDMYDLEMSACQDSTILLDPFQVNLLSD